MDEILASIRKIIAEEPADVRAESEAASNPLLTGTALRHDRSEKPIELNDRPRPSLDRLSSALKARATTPPPAPPPAPKPFFSMDPPAKGQSTFGIPTSSFEDDLADLLDAQAPKRTVTEELPKIGSLMGLTDGDEATTAAARTQEIVIEAIDEALLSGEEAQTFVTATASPTETTAPAGLNGHHMSAASAAGDIAENGPPPLQSKPAPVSPWDAMRKKGGYWPPQSATASTPAQSPAGSSVNGAYAEGSGPFPSKEAQQAHNASAPTTTADLIARLHAGLSEPDTIPSPPANLQFSVPLGASAPPPAAPYAHPQTNGAAYSPPPAPTNGYAPPPYAAPRAPDAQPVPHTPAPEPYPRPTSTDAIMNAALASLMNGGTPPPVHDPYARPQSPPPPDASARYQGHHQGQHQGHYPQNGYPGRDPDPTLAAAAAFDALAQGLAGASRPEQRRLYDYHPVTPSPSHTALVAQPLLPVVQEVHPQTVRTLEDAVAEMLKPMLQRWLADNMPRIIERALRVEAASGSKSSGSQ